MTLQFISRYIGILVNGKLDLLARKRSKKDQHVSKLALKKIMEAGLKQRRKEGGIWRKMYRK